MTTTVYVMKNAPTEVRVNALKEYASMQAEKPLTARVGTELPDDLPVHERDQLEALVRDNPGSCYLILEETVS